MSTSWEWIYRHRSEFCCRQNFNHRKDWKLFLFLFFMILLLTTKLTTFSLPQTFLTSYTCYYVWNKKKTIYILRVMIMTSLKERLINEEMNNLYNDNHLLLLRLLLMSSSNLFFLIIHENECPLNFPFLTSFPPFIPWCECLCV